MSLDPHTLVRDGKAYSIIDRAGTIVARLRMSRWRRSLAFAVDGAGFVGYWRRSTAILERDDGSLIVKLERPSAWVPALEFEHHGRRYDLRSDPLDTHIRRIFQVYRDDGVCVAEFDPTPNYPSTMSLRFGHRLPVEVSIFLFWVAWMIWELPSPGPG